MNTITNAVAEPNFRLRLTYADGAVVLVDFQPVIEVGGVFARLRDLEFFKQVKIGSRGRSIEWPGEIDFCADALRWTLRHDCGKCVPLHCVVGEFAMDINPGGE